jgi:hypothetical protein
MWGKHVPSMPSDKLKKHIGQKTRKLDFAEGRLPIILH